MRKKYISIVLQYLNPCHSLKINKNFKKVVRQFIKAGGFTALGWAVRLDADLIVEISPNGQKYFVIRAVKDGKEKRKHIGIYPEISLREARIKAVEARKDIFSTKPDKSIKFGKLTQEWLDTRMSDKDDKYVEKTKIRLNKYVLPEFKDTPVKEITSGAFLKRCRKIEARSTVETASRIKSIIGQIFCFAVAAGYCAYDVTSALRGALKTAKPKHYAAIFEPKEIALLMKSMRAYPYDITRAAMLFSIYTFVRPGEVRHAEWSEFDPGKAPATRRHYLSRRRD